MDDEGGEFLTPQRATPARYGLAALALIAETAQAISNFWSSVTVVTARHLLQVQVDEDFKEIVSDYDDTSCLRPGSPESKDGHRSSPEDPGAA